jgi:hypothetical protein
MNRSSPILITLCESCIREPDKKKRTAMNATEDVKLQEEEEKYEGDGEGGVEMMSHSA